MSCMMALLCLEGRFHRVRGGDISHGATEHQRYCYLQSHFCVVRSAGSTGCGNKCRLFRCRTRPEPFRQCLAEAILVGRGIDLFEHDLPRQNAALPVLVSRFIGMKLGHHLAGEKLQALANVLMQNSFQLGSAGLSDRHGWFGTAAAFANRIGRANEPAPQRLVDHIRVGRFPLLELLPDIDGTGARALSIGAHAVEA